jgi:hypothetical protein
MERQAARVVRARVRGRAEKPPFGTSINWRDPITTGLRAAYAFNEGAGRVIRNSCGTHGAGTLTNANQATAWVASPYGWALSLDGVNDFVNLGRSDALLSGTGSPFTMMALFRLIGTYSAAATLVRLRRAVSSSYASIVVAVSGAPYVGVYVPIEGGGSTAEATSDVSPRWLTVCYGRDATRWAAYVDGARTAGVSSGAPTSKPSADVATIGASAETATAPLRCEIAGLWIWNRLLAAEEAARACREPWCCWA